VRLTISSVSEVVAGMMSVSRMNEVGGMKWKEVAGSVCRKGPLRNGNE
jgi:hypothetical protein